MKRHLDQQEEYAEDVPSHEDEFHHFVSDVELIIESVLARLPSETSILRGVLATQVNALSINKTAVVETLQQLRQACTYRFLSCSYAGVNTDLIMKTQDYLQGMESWRNGACVNKRQLYDRFAIWVSTCPNMSIFQADLLAGTTGKQVDLGRELELQMSIDDIEKLVDVGYLRKRRDTVANDIYWFSHPNVCII